MQQKITKPSKLLNKCGKLIQKGYATSPILIYSREDVARKLRLKEWDYYLIYNDTSAVALTIGKSLSIVLISASIIDFNEKTEITKSITRIIPDKILSLPESSEAGDIIYFDKKVSISFRHVGQGRKLYLSIKNAKKETEFEASLNLTKEPKDSMVIATPFHEDKKGFFYNRKIVGMNATGKVYCEGKTYSYYPKNSLGILDWGRGVWPYKTTWYWSAGQGRIWGNLYGFNLGYGFGDTSAATENMLFFNGVASKLEDVVFHIPKDANNQYDYLKPWTITSSNHRIEMEFKPIIDRNVNLSFLVLSTNQHQVFGKFSGYAILDDGTIVFVTDMIGFAERVENRW
jgi:hypothetical protein